MIYPELTASDVVGIGPRKRWSSQPHLLPVDHRPPIFRCAICPTRLRIRCGSCHPAYVARRRPFVRRQRRWPIGERFRKHACELARPSDPFRRRTVTPPGVLEALNSTTKSCPELGTKLDAEQGQTAAPVHSQKPLDTETPIQVPTGWLYLTGWV